MNHDDIVEIFDREQTKCASTQCINSINRFQYKLKMRECCSALKTSIYKTIFHSILIKKLIPRDANTYIHSKNEISNNMNR